MIFSDRNIESRIQVVGSNTENSYGIKTALRKLGLVENIEKKNIQLI